MKGRHLGAALALAAVALPTLIAAPASAHTITGVKPTNYASEITSPQPAQPGVTVRLLDLGTRVRLTNTSNGDVVVFGYNSEPYLRVGPTGVFENRRSPATYLNRASSGAATTSTTLPPQADPAAPPEWHRTSTGHTVTWRDRRTRWEGPTPSSVRKYPHRRQVVASWTIGVQSSRGLTAVSGRIVWEPPPSALPWLALALTLVVTLAVAGTTRWWPAILSAALGLLVANDVIHSIAAVGAARDPVAIEVAKVLLGGFESTIAWAVALVAIPFVQQQRDGGVILGAAAATMLGLFRGITDTLGLGRSQIPFTLPSVVARAEVAVTLGLAVCLAVACTLVIMGRTKLPALRAGPS